jgi:hypothetical protein
VRYRVLVYGHGRLVELAGNLAGVGDCPYEGTMSTTAKAQRWIASARALPGLAVESHRRLGERERRLLVGELMNRHSWAAHPAACRAPGLKKCAPRQKTPMSLQLELFARGVARVR